MQYTKSEDEMRKYMVERGDFGLTYDELKDYENFYNHYPNICNKRIRALEHSFITNGNGEKIYLLTYFVFGKVEGKDVYAEINIIPYPHIIKEYFKETLNYIDDIKIAKIIDEKIFPCVDVGLDVENYINNKYYRKIKKSEREKIIKKIENEVDEFYESKWGKMSVKDYNNLAKENYAYYFRKQILEKMGGELADLQKERMKPKNKDNELIKKFVGHLETTLTADDESNMKDDFEQKYVYTRHIYEYVPLTYYDEYKTLDEFIDYVKECYLSNCDDEEAEEYGHEDLWKDIYNKYKVNFKNIYENWKDAFEEQKEKFLQEQDNSPSMKM